MAKVDDYQASSVRDIRSRFYQAREMGHDDKTATKIANGSISIEQAEEDRERRKRELRASTAPAPRRAESDLGPLDIGENNRPKIPPYGDPNRPAQQTASNRAGAPTGETKIGAGAIEIPENFAELPWNELRSLAKSIKDDVVRGKPDAVGIIEEELSRRAGAPGAGNDAGNYKPTENDGQDETERGRQERSKGQALDDGGTGGQGNVVENNERLKTEGIDDAAGANSDAERANNNDQPADKPVNKPRGKAAKAPGDDDDHERLENPNK